MNDRGGQVKSILKGESLPGFYRLKWDGTDEENKKVPAKNYIVRIALDRYVKYYAYELK
jgi:hypothetical protein